MSRTVIILGAGATRGADFRTARHGGAPLPSLDGDFFDRLLHISDGNSSHANLIRRVIADARWVAVGSTYPTLEAMFTYVEAAAQKPPGPAKINGRSAEEVRRELLMAVALQLGSALCNPNPDPGTEPHYRCNHHDWLMKRAENGGPGLTFSTTIVSFNYDCLMDMSLRGVSRLWNAYSGYFRHGVENWKEWTNQGVHASANSLKLLKMHGSLNWQDNGNGDINLTGLDYTDSPAPKLVPPEWNKGDLAQEPFNQIWDSAGTAISDAQSIVIIGYSMPVTDLRAQILFRHARERAERPLETLVIVNPDETAQNRVWQLFNSHRFDRKARVVRAKNWADFRSLPTDLWLRQ